MKKIGYIIPNFDDGGMPRVLETLSLSLKDDEYEQYLIVLIKGRKFNFKCNAKIIEVIEEGHSVGSKIITFLQRIKKIKGIKKELKFDCVVSFGVTANIINIVSRKDEKVVISEHSLKSAEHKKWGYYGKMYDLLIKNFYNAADKIIVVSKLIGEDLAENYNINHNKIEVIYNGVDIKFINNAKTC